MSTTLNHRLAAVLLLSAPLLAQTVPPADLPLQAKVTGNSVASDRPPAVRLEFDKGFKYAGGQRFTLYEVADAEQHFFFDADEKGNIRRGYWIQFEGYLPSNDHTYNYKSPKTAVIGGKTFILDAGPRKPNTGTPRPGSDGARTSELIAKKGLHLPDNAALVRLVLLSADKRNELMVIYVEDLAPHGVTADDLAPAGKSADRWPTIADLLLKNATANVKAVFPE